MTQQGDNDGSALSPQEEAQYQLALDRFREMFPERREAVVALAPFMAARSVDRMREGRLSPKLKRRLIWYVNVAPQAMLYQTVAGFLDQQHGQVNYIITRLTGTYRYFRYYMNDSTHALTYVSGRIVIARGANGAPVMAHWSNAESSEPKPDHTGFVFLSGENLFMLAMRQREMRLGIARIFDDRATGHMRGTLQSVRSTHKDPFSAKFAMVHEDNAELTEKLSDKTLEGEMTRGELAFRDLVPAGHGGWYMSL